MKGKVVITCDEHGVHIRTDITGMVEHEDVFLVHALGKSLGLSFKDYKILAIAEATGVLDTPHTSTLVTIDKDELCKQLEEESQDAR